MNTEQRLLYSQKTTRRMKLFERQFLRAMYSLINQQFLTAAQMVRDGKNVPEVIMIEGLGEHLTEIYDTVGVFYARKTKYEIERTEAKGFGSDQEWIDLIHQYFRLQLLTDAVLPISSTTMDDIRAILTTGTQEGWGVDKMAFELEHSDIPLWRARMIVRTETLKAQHYGKKAAEEESEFVTNKQWISAEDHRVRHSHRAADGQTVSTEGKFHVLRRSGGFDMMDGPGDPNASAENVINCRCTMAVRAARDSNGRLIRKRKISVLLPGDIVRSRQIVTV
jgi:hypothetical protein